MNYTMTQEKLDEAIDLMQQAIDALPDIEHSNLDMLLAGQITASIYVVAQIVDGSIFAYLSGATTA